MLRRDSESEKGKPEVLLRVRGTSGYEELSGVRCIQWMNKIYVAVSTAPDYRNFLFKQLGKREKMWLLLRDSDLNIIMRSICLLITITHLITINFTFYTLPRTKRGETPPPLPVEWFGNFLFIYWTLMNEYGFVQNKY